MAACARRVARVSVFIVVSLSIAATAHAQLVVAGDRPPKVSRSELTDIEVLVGAHDVLHIADMVTTAYALSRGVTAREANPVLRPLGGHPIALSVASGAFDVVEVWALMKLNQHHPKLAKVFALSLVATEVWATSNNVRLVGQIQRQNAGRRR